MKTRLLVAGVLVGVTLLPLSLVSNWQHLSESRRAANERNAELRSLAQKSARDRSTACWPRRWDWMAAATPRPTVSFAH